MSGIFNVYAKWNGEKFVESNPFIIDVYDSFRYLNRTRLLRSGGRGPALHVQQFTGGTDCMGSARCPEGIPCDPCVDRGSPYDLSMDPWVPYLCDGSPCGEQLWSFYQWKVYEGRKTDELKQITTATHGIEEEEAREECSSLIDEFFDEFPIR